MPSKGNRGYLWALVLALGFTGSAWAQNEFKVGLLYPTSGVYAGAAKQGIAGATLAFEEIGNQIGGRKVVLLVEDDEAKPEVALAKAKKLVENDKVQVMMGVIWSPNAMALRPYVHERKVPLVLSEAAVRPITQEARSPYIFRTSFASGQLTHPFGNYVCGKLGYRKIAVIGFDNVFGREETDFFEAGCKSAGGAVVEKIFAPLDTADFAPYFARIRQANPDAVWAIWAGAAALRFVQQYSEFGMKQKYPLLGIGPLTDEFILKAAGKAAEGVITFYSYSPAIDSPQNKRFVEAYRKRFGGEPGVFSMGGYLAARTIIEAAKAVKGDLSDTGAFLSALRAVQFETPSGKFRFDIYQNAVQSMYIRKVQPGAGGQLVNMPVDVLRDIEQYWPKGKPAK